MEQFINLLFGASLLILSCFSNYSHAKEPKLDIENPTEQLDSLKDKDFPCSLLDSQDDSKIYQTLRDCIQGLQEKENDEDSIEYMEIA